jgi:hypothetical protein
MDQSLFLQPLDVGLDLQGIPVVTAEVLGTGAETALAAP